MVIILTFDFKTLWKKKHPEALLIDCFVPKRSLSSVWRLSDVPHKTRDRPRGEMPWVDYRCRCETLQFPEEFKRPKLFADDLFDYRSKFWTRNKFVTHYMSIELFDVQIGTNKYVPLLLRLSCDNIYIAVFITVNCDKTVGIVGSIACVIITQDCSKQKNF